VGEGGGEGRSESIALVVRSMVWQLEHDLDGISL